MAHEPQLFNYPDRNAVASYHLRSWVVPLGARRMGIQSAHSAGKNFTTGLLGPHRTGLWKIRYPAASQSECSGRIRGAADHLYRHAGAVITADETSRPIRVDSLLAPRPHAPIPDFLRRVAKIQ